MGVLIDPPVWPAHGRLWAHLVSDVSLQELHAFASAHGVSRRGFERDHYDVPAELHGALVAAGAVPVSARDVVRRLHASGLRRRKSEAPSPRWPGQELLRAPRLAPGDRVGVVAPAGVVWEDRLARGIARLESWGLRVQLGEHVFARHGELAYLAGTDSDRAGDLTRAWTDDGVAAVMLARGGYGCQRMLDLLDWRRLAEVCPKPIIGFSDVTALHEAVASRLGLVSVHGHVVTSLGAASLGSAERLRRLLMQPELVTDLLDGVPVGTLVAGRAEGVLVGGNLMLLASAVGTSISRPARGGIVVLEDVSEPPYRVDRQITQLLRSGWFEGVRGIVLGAFTNCGAPRELDAVLGERLAPLAVPIVRGADLGHTPTTISVPLGVRATLDADAGSLVLDRPALV